jgi:hypothetical protein
LGRGFIKRKKWTPDRSTRSAHSCSCWPVWFTESHFVTRGVTRKANFSERRLPS